MSHEAKVHFTPPVGNESVVHPDLLPLFGMAGKDRLRVFPPGTIEVSRSALKQITGLVENLTASAGLTQVPSLTRVDCFIGRDGTPRVIEVNTQIPGASLTNTAAHKLYGKRDTAQAQMEILSSILGRQPIMLVTPGGSDVVASIGRMETKLGNSVIQKFGHSRSPIARIQVKEMSQATIASFEKAVDQGKPSMLWRFATDHALNTHIESLVRSGIPKDRFLKYMVNQPNTGEVGKKTNLARIKGSSIIVSATKVVVREGETYTVPRGCVLKPDSGLHARGVAFGGSVVRDPGEYLLQEFIEPSTTEIGGKRYHFDVGFYVVTAPGKPPQVFAASRVADPSRLVGDMRGGGLMPLIMKVTP